MANMGSGQPFSGYNVPIGGGSFPPVGAVREFQEGLIDVADLISHGRYQEAADLAVSLIDQADIYCSLIELYQLAPAPSPFPPSVNPPFPPDYGFPTYYDSGGSGGNVGTDGGFGSIYSGGVLRG